MSELTHSITAGRQLIMASPDKPKYNSTSILYGDMEVTTRPSNTNSCKWLSLIPGVEREFLFFFISPSVLFDFFFFLGEGERQGEREGNISVREKHGRVASHIRSPPPATTSN